MSGESRSRLNTFWQGMLIEDGGKTEQSIAAVP